MCRSRIKQSRISVCSWPYTRASSIRENVQRGPIHRRAHAGHGTRSHALPRGLLRGARSKATSIRSAQRLVGRHTILEIAWKSHRMPWMICIACQAIHGNAFALGTSAFVQAPHAVALPKAHSRIEGHTTAARRTDVHAETRHIVSKGRYGANDDLIEDTLFIPPRSLRWRRDPTDSCRRRAVEATGSRSVPHRARRLSIPHAVRG